MDEVEHFIETHEQDFINFKSDLLLGEAGNDPLKKANLINDIADTIALIPDAVKRSVYVDTCAEKFHIDAEILFERIHHSRGEMLLADRKQRERERTDRKDDIPVSAVVSLPEEDTGPAAGNDAGVLNDAFLAPCEKELLGFILTNGDSVLSFDVDSEYYVDGEEPPMVAEFIDSALSVDGLYFANDCYRKVYDLYFELWDEGLGREQICRRMLDHTDRSIAGVAAELIIDKYIITVRNYQDSMTSEQTRMVMFVPKAILAYQSRIIERKLQQCSDRLASISPDDAEGLSVLLKEIGELNKVRKLIISKMGRG